MCIHTCVYIHIYIYMCVPYYKLLLFTHQLGARLRCTFSLSPSIRIFVSLAIRSDLCLSRTTHARLPAKHGINTGLKVYQHVSGVCWSSFRCSRWTVSKSRTSQSTRSKGQASVRVAVRVDKPQSVECATLGMSLLMEEKACLDVPLNQRRKSRFQGMPRSNHGSSFWVSRAPCAKRSFLGILP